SFYANKNITTGEGGMVTTNDDAMAEKFRVMRLQGLSRDAWKRYGKSGFSQWQLHLPGFKYNMADVNAALGIHQLKKVDKFLELRKRYVDLYNEGFRGVPEVEPLQIRDYAQSAHHIYVIALKLEELRVSRDEFLTKIQEAGVGVAVHYVALHLQPYYQETCHYRPEDFPVATHYSERILSLPLYPKMSRNDVERVIQLVVDLIAKYRR
ncbi:MAG: UDP-4-amino-4,6-dideoxy-N-acetyl-beta-L-altrosamine transaminase, partial [bacterium]|nr:UDP-4-amino-4,6-dideoxy-N-acetyl-beta-L-altrosamine transaminase [bacterium]